MSSVAPFDTLGQALELSGRRTIPFDYAFRYQLTGERSTVLSSAVTVSVEATFVAVSIGYGVIAEVSTVPVGLEPPPPPPGSIILASIVRSPQQAFFDDLARSIKGKLGVTARRTRGDSALGAALRTGLRLNPRFASVVLSAIESGTDIDPRIASRMFEVIGPPAEEIQFLYALFDEGTGREFQSEPILNTAGLGISNGDRPFRYFPKPIVFRPRSTIRLQITEISQFKGDLHVSLQGYKVLGESGTPTATLRRRLRRRPGAP
jgi:hypothetical protein